MKSFFYFSSKIEIIKFSKNSQRQPWLSVLFLKALLYLKEGSGYCKYLFGSYLLGAKAEGT